MAGIVAQFRAMFWLALCCRKRSVISILLQILLPLILTYLFKFTITPNEKKIIEKQIMNVRSKESILKFQRSTYLVFAPDTHQVHSLVDNVKEILNKFNSYEKIEFHIIDDETEMEGLLRQHAGRYMYSNCDYGIVINSISNKNLNYSLRNILFENWKTGFEFRYGERPGTMKFYDPYLFDGFLQLQIAIDESFMKMIGIASVEKWNLQEFPYPQYKLIDISYVGQLLLFWNIGFMYFFVSLIRHVAEEKETGIWERLKMSGVKPWVNYTTWITNWGIVAIICSITIPSLLKMEGILKYSNYFIIFMTLLLFCLSAILYAIVIAHLFTKTVHSQTFGLIFWVGTHLFFVEVLDHSASAAAMFSASMTPTGFLISSMNTIFSQELHGNGATFSKLFSQTGWEKLPLGEAWIAAILRMMIIIGLILYLDAVLPGKHGVPKPFCFIIPKRLRRWCRRIIPRRKATTNASPEQVTSIDGTATEQVSTDFEAISERLPVGIKIRQISKHFGKVIAVNNCTIDIYKSQITALLGLNGAGKSTLLEIITGMLPPTSGHIETEDYDVSSSLEKFRNDVGYCPQEDLLLPCLSVQEHLMFFAFLKGYRGESAVQHVEIIMNKCGLADISESMMGKLSGGTRRKLSLAISMVSEPPILILDEPTFGLDPNSRRDIWDLLLRLRTGHTILFTTHYMEEADVLADRIAIMSQGEIISYGTTIFMKRHFGAAYKVTILLADGTSKTNREKIISIVKSEIPMSSVNEETLEKISVRLPLMDVQKFPTVFSVLEKRKDLGITNLVVSCSSIDDVFLRAHELRGAKFTVDEDDNPLNIKPAGTSNYIQCSLLWQRFCAIACKKLIWLYRNWFTALLNLVLPSIIMLIFMFSQAIPQKSLPLRLDLTVYPGSDVVIADDKSKYYESIKNLVLKQGSHIIKSVPPNSLIDQLLNYAEENENYYRESMIIAANLSKSPTILYSSIAIHAPAIAVNIFSNAVLQAASPSSASSITTYNYPFKFTSDTCDIWVEHRNYDFKTAFSGLLTFCIVVILSFFIMSVHIERSTLFKEQLLITGMAFPIYWIFTFIIDFIIYVCVAIIMVAIIVLTDSSGMSSNWFFIGPVGLLLCLVGISGIWNAYLWSYFFKRSTQSVSIFRAVTMALVIAGYASMYYARFKQFRIKNVYCFFLNPIYSFSYAIYHVTSMARYKCECESCNNCSHVRKIDARSMINDINLELKYLAFDSLLYLLLVFLIDTGLPSYLHHLIKAATQSIHFRQRVPSMAHTDPDVILEKSRVINLFCGTIDEDIILYAKEISKTYSRKLIALKDVNFSVLQGQCFGLLGTNGAGKSTMFRILTGSLRPTKGDTFINCYRLSKDKRKYRHQFGYSPQSDGLMGDLTGKETLKLFANLKGIPKRDVDILVEKWINALALTNFQNRKICTYSGGNFRKLSTAIALIGNPPVVFLDDTTSGVDPVIRHRIWQILKMAKANNQTIVIASHSMDECEALCDKLTILVRGTMRCIGNVQYLRKVHGQGYTVLIKLGTVTDKELADLKREIGKLFEDKCILKDEQQGLLHYELPQDICSRSQLFRRMAQFKSKHRAVVEDYVLTDTSLEQVFLSIARQTL